MYVNLKDSKLFDFSAGDTNHMSELDSSVIGNVFS